MSKKILVSSCLMGEKCSYDGQSRDNKAVRTLCEHFGYVHICPEMAGGLGCPREKHEIAGGTGSDVLDGDARVMSITGKDDTGHLVKGAEKALGMAKKENSTIAILKARSPSCGKNKIYAGKFDGELIEGAGVTAALLKRNGIKVFTEEEIDQVRIELSSY